MLSPSPSPRTGPVLAGRYQLIEPIGEGGMGIVWRGFDLDLEEAVAIKLLRDDVADDAELRAAFRREVKLARRVTHPNVARVFEFGHDGGRYFLTMEFVEGETLKALLQRGPLPADQTLPFAVSLCRGLAAAHGAAVVHGDIKPGNILLAPNRGAVLTDFGIARALSEGPDLGEGSIGTPHYMAPELFDDAAKTLRSDVYALGVVFFEALTAQTPWADLDFVSLIGLKHAREQPDLVRLAPTLTPAWLDLINDCLRGDPARRPTDAQAVLARLAQMHDGPVPMTARPTRAPFATENGPQWVEIAPFQFEDELGSDWLTGDIVGALTSVRGVRVMSGAAAQDGPPVVRRAEVKGEVRKVEDGVVVEVEVVGGGTGAPRSAIAVHQPLNQLHNLGSELAARIVTALDPGRAPIKRRQPDELDPAATDLYLQARSAFLAMRPYDALRLYEAALALAPQSPMLRLGRLLAMAKIFLLLRETRPDEIASMRVEAEQALAEFGDLGEPYLLMSGLLLTVNEPIAAATYIGSALSRAPSLVPAHGILADILMDIGRLPDAERRLDIAAALDSSSVQICFHRAQLLAYQGRWTDFYGLVEGRLADLHFRSVHTLRLMLWHPDAAALARLDPVIAGNQDNLPDELWRDAHDLLAFLLDRDRPAILERLLARYPGTWRTRHGRLFAQILCEMACIVGDLERARQQLVLADECTLADWFWIERCPTIEPLRADATFVRIREKVRARADAVAEAIWG